MKNNKTILLLILAVIVANVIIYAKTANFDFVNYDDPDYVIHNPLIKDFDQAKLKKVFSEYYFFNYQPVMLLTYAAEYSAFSDNASGYHIVSTLLHILNAILVLLLIYSLSNNLTSAFIVALIFSLFPLHVETVAWVF